MRYSPDEFFRLMDEVHEQGGEHLDESHDTVVHERYTGDKRLTSRDYVITYCNESALFEVPYEGGAVKVCAVDDMMGRWPRFEDADARGIV